MVEMDAGIKNKTGVRIIQEGKEWEEDLIRRKAEAAKKNARAKLDSVKAWETITDPPGTDPPGTDPPGTDPPGTDLITTRVSFSESPDSLIK